MKEAGLHRIKMMAHMVHSTRMEQAGAFFNRLQPIVQAISEEAGLTAEVELLEMCEQAIKRGLFAGMPKRLGFSCHIVPVFLCLGIKA